MARLTVGGIGVDEAEATEIVERHVQGEPGFYGFSVYDDYFTNGDPDTICDGDLLAPVLLNVRMSISTFARLRASAGEIKRGLHGVRDIPLADADDSVVAAIGSAYSVLDDRRPKGVRGTTLAKILHRKRPQTIPLYDEHVRLVYQEGGRIPVNRDRSWVEFMTLFAAAVREDLAAAPDGWSGLCDLAPPGGPRLTPVRALDIVAWGLGARRADVP